MRVFASLHRSNATLNSSGTVIMFLSCGMANRAEPHMSSITVFESIPRFMYWLSATANWCRRCSDRKTDIYYPLPENNPICHAPDNRILPIRQSVRTSINKINKQDLSKNLPRKSNSWLRGFAIASHLVSLEFSSAAPPCLFCQRQRSMHIQSTRWQLQRSPERRGLFESYCLLILRQRIVRPLTDAVHTPVSTRFRKQTIHIYTLCCSPFSAAPEHLQHFDSDCDEYCPEFSFFPSAW